ncbi:MAG: universal stress protein [Leptospiraceae bacterium]|nr:universal stress protein [Leptospiraceae bacterium]MDW8306327.1 universal stress protein [Leptospiraceae bacterium]
MRILMALDHGKEKDILLREITARPWPNGSVFYLCHCVEIPYPGVQEGIFIPPDLYGELLDDLRKKGGQLLEEASKYLEECQFPHEIKKLLREGPAKKEIVALAKEEKIHLICLASHRQSRLEKLFLGSVSLYVASHAPCSVEIIRAPNY